MTHANCLRDLKTPQIGLEPFLGYPFKFSALVLEAEQPLLDYLVGIFQESQRVHILGFDAKEK